MRGGRDELAELLRRAGLDIVGDWRVEEVLPPAVAWRRVIGSEVEPTVKAGADRPDQAGEVNRQWHRLASETGVLGADGVFLISVAGDGAPCAGGLWTRVRLTAEWDLAGVLGGPAGQPEFLTVAADGDALVAVTNEGDSVRLIAEDRIKERQEAAAQAAARETPQEREAAWERLLQGPQPTEELLDAWACGLSLNPAAPPDLRVGLLGRSPYVLYCALPTEVVDAALAHPDWKLRQDTAQYQPNVSPEQWARVILGEQDERHRWILTMLAADRWDELTEDTCHRLAADPSPRVRSETARLKCLPASLSVALAADPDGGVRCAACRAAWPHLVASAREALLTDPHDGVRARALLLHHQEHPMPRSVFEGQDVMRDALETCRLERDLAEHLARNGEPAERRALAGNPRLDPDLVALLGEDPDHGVRWEVSIRADLTEEQRAGVRIDFDPGIHHHALDWVRALHDDHDAMRRLAASSHPLVRRSVARARHLPPDVVATLARDEDRVVHLFLAESCDDAPADLLMEVWQWWTGSLSCPDRPHGHPNFPREGLLRYADDPNPRMRRLALDDPESDPGLVERLSRDPSAEVRYRAATDPRLPAACAARLLEDPHDHVRHAAALHPRLPVRVLTPLLGDTGGAETAARNPALPVEVMRRMAERMRDSATGVTG
ncbi:PE-PGRS family protein [Streptomyces spongiae]|uniref:PE-PGRS family protein n=1 Tax=Streptomyces spongiae TaxID=565072 RepID=A0A5N8XTS0_9ACTN|nr:PE-PGRS family protein [Streptomyces spongiae]MPY62025.1 PE-PGRS family protein [Streptomyces spongiae]